MSSLKDAAAVLQEELEDAQNKYDMSVTPEVSHVEMWPYVASAAVAFESHAATACSIFQYRSRRPAPGGREKNYTRQLPSLCSFPSVCWW